MASLLSDRRPSWRPASLALLGTLAVLLSGCDAIPRFLAQDPPEPPFSQRRAADGEPALDDGPQRLESPPSSEESAVALRMDQTLILASAPEAWRIEVGAAPAASQLVVTAEAGVRISATRQQEGLRAEWTVSPGEPATLGPLRGGGVWLLEVRASDGDVTIERTRSSEEVCGLAVPGATNTFLMLGAGVGGCPVAGAPLEVTLPRALFVEAGVFGVRVEAPPSGPLRLEAVDADGALWFEADIPPGEALVLPNLGRPVSPGDVLLRVRSSRETPSPVQLRVFPPPEVGEAWLEREPNDTVATAERLLGDRPVAGILHSAEDVDVFRLAPVGAGLFRIVLEPRTGFTPALAVLDDDGGESAGQVTELEGGLAVCAVDLSEEEPLLFRVTGSDVEEFPAAYRVLIEHLDTEGWHLTPAGTLAEAEASLTRARREAAQVEREPLAPPSVGAVEETSDESADEERAPVSVFDAVGASVAAVRGMAGGEGHDRWVLLEVTGEEEEWVSVRLELEPGGPVPVTLAVHDDDGALVGRAPARGVGAALEFGLDLPPGRYGVRVGGHPPARRCTAPWTLRVEGERPQRSAPVAAPVEGATDVDGSDGEDGADGRRAPENLPVVRPRVGADPGEAPRPAPRPSFFD